MPHARCLLVPTRLFLVGKKLNSRRGTFESARLVTETLLGIRVLTSTEELAVSLLLAFSFFLPIFPSCHCATFGQSGVLNTLELPRSCCSPLCIRQSPFYPRPVPAPVGAPPLSPSPGVYGTRCHETRQALGESTLQQGSLEGRQAAVHMPAHLAGQVNHYNGYPHPDI